VLGRLLYEGARNAEKGLKFMADVYVYAPHSKDILFTDSHGNNVNFQMLLREGINVNKNGELNSQDHSIRPTPDDRTWNLLQDEIKGLNTANARDAAAVAKRKGHQKQ